MSSLIALLGRTRKPTCGIDDYCSFLGEAFAQQGVLLERVQMDWGQAGWIKTLLHLWRKAADWREKWVLMQYTAGAWSRHGFPVGALCILAVLRLRNVRCAVMFHEPYAWEVPPTDWLDRVRSACQNWVIHTVYRYADKGIFADPLETISWLPKNRNKAAFIPIGGNIPEPSVDSTNQTTPDTTKTISVFCLSDPPRLQRELEEISYAMRSASSSVSKLRLVLLGKGTIEAQEEIERAFAETSVEIVNMGVCGAEKVSRALADSDVMLCVRGQLFPRRGSALAGIACGVPIIAYCGTAQLTPIAEAGVEFVPHGDKDALGANLTRVLTDSALQEELRSRSRLAQAKYFSWKKIAQRHIEALGVADVKTTALANDLQIAKGTI
jgi:glycosyltransferase involved in cell wall biosynthesis